MKRKWKILVLGILLWTVLLGLKLPAQAAPEGPRIILQPQNYHYPEYSTAVYTVKAEGTNLRATWYLEFEGKTYNISDMTNGFEPWEAYAGESYGPQAPDGNTFICFFGGIGEELDGSAIWCVIEDGHNDVTSARAIITVRGTQMPPEILEMPTVLSAEQGTEAQIRCVARSGGESQLTFQWYETDTGELRDIQALEGEDADYLFCDTDTVGTRYYVCAVRNTLGGAVYSSVVAVTVTPRQATEEPTAPTDAVTPTTAPTDAVIPTTAPTDPADPDPTQGGAAPTVPETPGESAPPAHTAPPAQDEDRHQSDSILPVIALLTLALGAGGLAFLVVYKKNRK